MNRRVKVIKTHYDKKRDLVRWLVKDISEGEKKFDTLTLAWPGADLGQALGINIRIPPELIGNFCNDITGKEINLVMNAAITDVDSNIFNDKSDEESILKAHSQLDQFPYHEVLSQIEEENDVDD